MVLMGCPHGVIFSDIFVTTHAKFTLFGTIIELAIPSSCSNGHSSTYTASLCFFTLRKLKKIMGFIIIFLKHPPHFSCGRNAHWDEGCGKVLLGDNTRVVSVTVCWSLYYNWNTTWLCVLNYGVRRILRIVVTLRRKWGHVFKFRVTSSRAVGPWRCRQNFSSDIWRLVAHRVTVL
jgi:hypothetical protein